MAGNLPRVGFLTGDIGQRHGWARYSLDLLQALQRAGLPMTVVSARNSPDDTPLEQQRLLPNTSPAQGQLLLRNLLAAPSVARALHSCDLIHTLVEPYAVCGSQVAGRRPHLVTAHGSYVALLSRRPWPARLVWRRALERAQLVCDSSWTARVAQQVLAIARSPASLRSALIRSASVAPSHQFQHRARQYSLSARSSHARARWS